MPSLKITTLGKIEFELDGKPVTGFDTEKTRALLVYLTIENARPQSRSFLAGLLWSDQTEEQALHGLRQSLSNLRKALGEGSAPIPLLITTRETVQINPEADVWVDVRVIRETLKSAYRYYERCDLGGWLNVRLLQRAVNLYQGSFLAHFELRGGPLYDEWMLLTREEIDRQVTESLSHLSEYHERRGEFAQARKMAEQITRIAPWNEFAHVQLIRLLALDQQWTAAQNQYAALRRYLTEQMAVEPAPETVELIEQIRRAAGQHKPMQPRFPPALKNLPDPSDLFIGRELELDDIADRLVDPRCRLLTLLGPGGIGKTRLAIEAAHQQVGIFNDGVFFVSLATAASPDQVFAAIADAVRLSLTEQSNLSDRVIDFLRGKRILLVLDNFEQLLDDPMGTTAIVTILERARGIILLVTSRERLLLQEEWVYPLNGLRYPQNLEFARNLPTAEHLSRFDALALFLQRAKQATHEFALDPSSLQAITSICQMLEGLPLGVELAASAVWNHSAGKIAEKIASNLNAMEAASRNIVPRHRSLWAAFDVSWNLLTAGEQDTLRRLSIFQGSFSGEAALEVANATSDLLANLTNQSLIHLNENGRYEMHLAVRQYAAEKLEEHQEGKPVRAAHARYYSSQLYSWRDSLEGKNQKIFLDRIQQELGNVKAAWEWATDQGMRRELAQSMDAIYTFFNIRSRFEEGIGWFQRVIEAIEASGHAEPDQKDLLGMALARAGSLAYYARQNAFAREGLERAQDLFARLNNPVELAFTRITLGGVYNRAKEFGRAVSCAQQNLAYYQQVGSALGETRTLYLLGLIYNRLGKFAESKELLIQCIAAGRSIEDRRRLVAPLNLLGDIACIEGDYRKAEELFMESYAITVELEDLYYQAIVLNNLATIQHLNSQWQMARSTYEKSLDICRKIGDRDGEAMALNNLGELAVAQQNYSQAVEFSEKALRIAQEIEEEWTIIVCYNNLGEAYCALGEYALAMEFFRDAIRTARNIEAVDSLTRLVVNAGRCLQLHGFLKEAADLYQAALAHSAIEHDSREKASRWLSEIAPSLQPIEPDDGKLEVVIHNLFFAGI